MLKPRPFGVRCGNDPVRLTPGKLLRLIMLPHAPEKANRSLRAMPAVSRRAPAWSYKLAPCFALGHLRSFGRRSGGGRPRCVHDHGLVGSAVRSRGGGAIVLFLILAEALGGHAVTGRTRICTTTLRSFQKRISNGSFVNARQRPSKGLKRRSCDNRDPAEPLALRSWHA